jgi:hypothetical protein
MRLNSRDLLRQYANKGVNFEVLRYARNRGYIKYYIEEKHFEYEDTDIIKWLNDYVIPKGQMRGTWRKRK